MTKEIKYKEPFDLSELAINDTNKDDFIEVTMNDAVDYFGGLKVLNDNGEWV